MLADLFQRRVIFILGKGGVGTTSVSAAFALKASETGNVLAMECDSRAPMAAALGARQSYQPEMVTERLFTSVLEGRHALEEYLRLVIPARAVLRAVFASRLYQFFVQAAPGLKELMMLGKIYYEAERKVAGNNQWDLIVVDAPASGQALSVLKMPDAAQQTFGESVVGREAGNIRAMLRNEKLSGIVLVSTPEPLPISETLETAATLRKIGITPAAIVFNRSREPRFTMREVTGLRDQIAHTSNKPIAERLYRIAKVELDRAKEARRALEQLRNEVGVPVIELPQMHLSGRELVAGLAGELRFTTAAPSERIEAR